MKLTIKSSFKYSTVILLLPFFGFFAYYTDIVIFEAFGFFYSIPGQYISLAVLWQMGIENESVNIAFSTLIVLSMYYAVGNILYLTYRCGVFIANIFLEKALGNYKISNKTKASFKAFAISFLILISLWYFLVVLLPAACHNKHSVVLYDKEEINKLDGSGMTPIHIASEYGNISLVKRLINQGADIDMKDKYGSNALSWAIAGGHNKTAYYLLENEIDFHNKDTRGGTVLNTAILHGEYEIVKELIERGAEVNNRDNKGYTPLHDAVIAREMKIAKLLIDHGADVNSQGKCGHYPAGRHRNVNECEGYKGFTPLQIAAGIGDKKMAELLLNNGADPAISNFEGHNAEKIAYKRGHMDIIKMFEKTGEK